jgi:hypothetical protein
VFSSETLVITYQTGVNREKSVMMTCIPEMAGSNVVRDIDYPEVIRRFTQSSMQMPGHDLKIESDRFLPHPEFCYSLIILPFDAIHYELQSEWLKP